MGRAIVESCLCSDGKFTVISGSDITSGESKFPVYSDIRNTVEVPDVIIDFSHHTALPAILEYAVKNNIPAVISTTGHTEEELSLMHEASKQIPIFYSRNMSLGVNLLMALCRKATEVLGEDFDIEIIEKHHRNKLDAPSGTALMIADAISEVRKENGTDTNYTYDRQKERRKRTNEEIGIHSVRGGGIIGEHEVIFAGKEEVITISHSAATRELFATGALRASEYILGKAPGMYNMDNLLKEIM